MNYKQELQLILTNKGLTGSQITIAYLASIGLSNAEIANQLFKSERSIKQYLSRIYIKLSVKSRAQLIVWSLSNTVNHAYN